MRKNIEHKEYTLLYDACMHIKLIADFETINKKIDFMTEISSEDFLPLNQKLRLYQKSLHIASENDAMDKRIVASGAYNSIAELTKDMQFHDIIHQRLDHIRKINKNILNELSEISYDPFYLNSSTYIKIIPQLAMINFVQIQAVNMEYRSVIKNLKKTLTSMNHFLNMESSLSEVYYFSNVSLFSVLAETICNKLENISELIFPEKGSQKYATLEEVAFVKEVYTMRAERDIFDKVIKLLDKNLGIQKLNAEVIRELKTSVSDNRFELF